LDPQENKLYRSFEICQPCDFYNETKDGGCNCDLDSTEFCHLTNNKQWKIVAWELLQIPPDCQKHRLYRLKEALNKI
jgi:hypothetical protein